MLALMVWGFFFFALNRINLSMGRRPHFCSWKWRRKCGFYLYGM